MKIGFMSDEHFSGKSLKPRLKCLDEALSIMQKRRVDWLLRGGDTFNCGSIFDGVHDARRAYSATEILGGVYDSFSQFKKPIITLLGNHDIIESDPLGHSALSSLRNPMWLHHKKPGVHMIASSDEREIVMIICIPWVHPLAHAQNAYADVGAPANLPWAEVPDAICRNLKIRKMELMAEFRKKPVYQKVALSTILLGHVEVRGAWGDSYVRMLPGAAGTFSVEGLQSIGADISMFGHIHARQALWDTGHYIGALTRLTFGEADNPDGFAIYDTRTRDLKWYELSSGPRFHKNVTPGQIKAFDLRDGDHVKFSASPLAVAQDPSLTSLCLESGVAISYAASTKRVASERPSLVGSSLWDLLSHWMSVSGLTPTQDVLSHMQKILDSLQVEEVQTAALGTPARISRIRFESMAQPDCPHFQNFQINLPPGTTCLTGPTGKGKSMLLESLVAALWGNWVTGGTDRTLAKTALESGKSTLEVDFYLVGCDTPIRVSRIFQSRDQKAWVYTGEDDHTWNCEAGDKVTAVTSFLEGLVGKLADNKALSTWFLGQDAQGDLTASGDAARMGWFRSWLGLTHLDDAAKRLKADHPSPKVAKTIANQILDQQSTVDNLLGKITEWERYVAQHKQAESDIVARLEASGKSLNNLLEEISLIPKPAPPKANLDSLLVDMEDLDQSFQLLRRQRGQMLNHLEGLRLFSRNLEFFQAARAAGTKAEHQSRLKEIEAEIETYSIKIHTLSLKNQARQSDVHCVKSLDGAGCADNPLPCRFIQNAIEAKARLEGAPDLTPELIRAEKALQSLRNSLATPRAHIAAYEKYESDALKLGLNESERNNIEATIKDLQHQIDELTNTLNQRRAKYEESEQAKRQIEKEAREAYDQDLKIYEESRNEIRAKISQTRDLEEQMRSEQLAVTSKISQLQEMIRRAQTDLAKAREEIQKLEEEAPKAQAVELLGKALGPTGLAQYLIDSEIPALQTELDYMNTEYLDGLHPVELTTQKESGSETFQILYKGRDVRGASGGQRSLVRIMLRLALNRVRDCRGLLILDEPTAAQDAVTTAATMALLKGEEPFYSQILFSTHDHQLALLWENSVQL